MKTFHPLLSTSCITHIIIPYSECGDAEQYLYNHVKNIDPRLVCFVFLVPNNPLQDKLQPEFRCLHIPLKKLYESLKLKALRIVFYNSKAVYNVLTKLKLTSADLEIVEIIHSYARWNDSMHGAKRLSTDHRFVVSHAIAQQWKLPSPYTLLPPIASETIEDALANFKKAIVKANLPKVTISFCIPVKNRSCVDVWWNGVMRNKTYITSYKQNPRNFRLNLLPNLVDSILKSRSELAEYEIVIADFNSTDIPLSQWLSTKIKDIPGVTGKVISVDGNFSRGKGRNIAQQNSTGDILFYLDADMLISADLIVQAIYYTMIERKAFFPICYSYLTPFHNQGWLREEGWGNLALSSTDFPSVSWWEKQSWGSEDNHMRDMLEGRYIREPGLSFFHQWHPEEEFKTKFDSKQANRLRVCIGVTTYNRISYLRQFVDSWYKTRNPYYDWTLIIADDGSTDETNEYLKSLKFEDVSLHIIKHHRVGVHESTNSIFDRLNTIGFDFAFKCDDDIIFMRSGWDNLYIQALDEHKYLCNYNTHWRKAQVIKRTKLCEAHSNAYYSQGAFFAFTPEVLSRLGWFDTKTFGFKGYGHIDFSVRACRAGFNNFNTFFDAADSAEYLALQSTDYKPALSPQEMLSDFRLIVDETQKEIMKDLILNQRKDTIYVHRNSIYEFTNCEKKPRIHLVVHNNNVGGAEYVHFCHALFLHEEAHCDVTVWSVGQGLTFQRYRDVGIAINFVPNLWHSEKNTDWELFTSSVRDGDFIYNCNAYNDHKFKAFSQERYFYYVTILHSDVDWIIKHQQSNRYFTYKFIAIHEGIRDKLIAQGVSSSKVEIVPNCSPRQFKFGFDPIISNTLRKLFSIPSTAIVIGYVGRLDPDKNALDIIQVAEHVLRTRKDFYFILIGATSSKYVSSGYGAEVSSAINWSRSNIEHPERFISLGEIEPTKVYDYLDLIDVSLNLSPSEGFPIALIEQLAKDCICIYPRFSAIDRHLQLVGLESVPIQQRFSREGLRLSAEEKMLYIERLSVLNLEDVQNLRHKHFLSRYAEKEFGWKEASSHLRAVFIKGEI